MDNHLNLHGVPAYGSIPPRTLALALFPFAAVTYLWRPRLD